MLCEWCKIVEVTGRRFCSTMCRSKYASSKRTEYAHSHVSFTCETCGLTKMISYSDRRRRFCSQACKKASPIDRANGSVRMLLNNPMFNSDTCSKQSKTRKEKFATDPIFAAKHSQIMCDAWASGKYDNVPVGKCKWYSHVKPSGELIKLQGTWEVAVARYFDVNNINYITHRGRFPYVTPDGVTRSYYPDFFLTSTNEHVDVKGAFWNWEQREKLDHIRNSNPTMKLVIYDKQKLEELNIDYVSVQKELL